jgi:hypothetical protein
LISEVYKSGNKTNRKKSTRESSSQAAEKTLFDETTVEQSAGIEWK